MERIYYKTLPVKKLFIDGVKENIYYGNVRQPHGKEGPGYQRDPYTRMNWISEHAADIDEHLLRAIEVSPRPDGMYAIIDGGGRWLMSELGERLNVVCRVHEGVTRAEEAMLFAELDSEVYKLRPIDNFLALLGAGDEMAREIEAAVAPYRIAANGKGTLKCVGPLTTIYTAFDDNFTKASKVLGRTSRVLAATWSGYDGKDQWSGRGTIDARFFPAIALVVEAAGTGLDEGVLRKVLSSKSNAIPELEKKIAADFPGKHKTHAYSLLVAQMITKAYNKSFVNKPERRIAIDQLQETSIYDAMCEQRAFKSRWREYIKSHTTQAQAA